MNAMPYMSQTPAGPTGTPRFGGQSEQKKWGDTTSKQGEISRIFVASVDYKSTSCDEIEQRFQNYGKICGIDLNQKNFVFVQFSTVEEAQNACQAENGSFFKGKKIEVRVFDKSGHPTKGRGGPGGGPAGPPMGGRNRERSRSPNRVTGGRVMGGPTGTRHGSMMANMGPDPYTGYGGGPPQQPPPEEPVVGNEAEIIVVDRQQWRYAEMLEQRIKRETGIRFIDMLFLHTPSSLNMTLNDLFERQTVYALVVTPVNEEHRSITLHVLHNQTEHRNMPLEDAILLINKDFQALTGRSGPPPGTAQPPSVTTDRSQSGDTLSKLPEEVSYLLRTIMSENGTQFLSPTQLDLLIDWLQKEKTKLLSKGAAQSTNSYMSTGAATSQSTSSQLPLNYEKQRSNLLDNPHVQAALSSLIQIGALGSANSSANSGNNTSNNGMPLNSYSTQQNNSAPTRRHPLMGTEIQSATPQQSIAGAPGGLVKYPLPQTYNQYSYQF